MSGPSTPAPANDILDRAGDLAIEIVNDMREAAPQVTEAAVRYVWAQGVAGLVMGALGVVIALTVILTVAAPLFKRAAAPTGSYSESNRAFNYGMGAVFVTLASCILGALALAQFGEAIPAVLAPEGATVMKLIAAARGG